MSALEVPACATMQGEKERKAEVKLWICRCHKSIQKTLKSLEKTMRVKSSAGLWNMEQAQENQPHVHGREQSQSATRGTILLRVTENRIKCLE